MRREHLGLLYDEWEVGKKYWGMERAITETDLVMMNYLSRDVADGPLFEDNGKGTKVAYVHGALTFIIAQGLMTSTFVFDGSYIAALSNNITYKKAVLIGDTIRPYMTAVSKRESKSRPGVGIVDYVMEVLNQRDEVVLYQEFSMMIAKSFKIAEEYKLVTL